MQLFLDLTTDNVNLTDYNVAGILVNDPAKYDGTKIPVLQLKDATIYSQGKKVGRILTVTSSEEMSAAMQLELGEEQYIYLKTGNWKVIPIENLIARFGDSATLMVAAQTVQEVKLAEEILEIGVDVAVVPPIVYQQLQQQETEHFDLEVLTVASITEVGSGDRVCVDTAAILTAGEGLLVGGTSSAFVLVEAEVAESGYVNARPFRVNAGPVSSYVLGTKKTQYLSELRAGVTVTIVAETGKIRHELVGRVKIERRPLVLIQVEYEGKQYPVMLQNAETVRLLTADGSKGVHTIAIGDKVKGLIVKSGRHFGMSVDEYIEEY